MSDALFTSDVIKTIVMKERVLFGHDLYGVTESLNYADVITVNPRGYVFEFEVKISRSDLKSELDAMDYWLATGTSKQLSLVDSVVNEAKTGEPIVARKILHSEKWKKHYSYLVAEELRFRRPRCFYFVVPPTLQEYALVRLAHSPYGLYVAHRTDSNGYMHNYRKASPLSSNKMIDGERAAIMQRIQTENITMKIAKHLRYAA
jgi:hypothetical protein